MRQPRPQADERTEEHPDRWRILFVTLLIGFMALLDVTIVNVALPSIQSGLRASAATVQWVVSGYALAFGLVLVAGGRLGDLYGRRTLLLVGLAGFVLSSAAVGAAPTSELVVAARLLQGFSAGLLTPQSSGLIQQLFRGRERGIAFGYFGTTVALASATGPILGGLIIAAAGPDLGWRLIFAINVPIGLVAAVFVWRRVPKRSDRPARGQWRRDLDVVGALLLGGAVLCLLLPTIQAENGLSWVSLMVLGTPIFALAFVIWERHVRRIGRPPLLDLELLRRTNGYASGIAVGTVYFTGFTGIFLVLSIFLQDGAGYSALMTGLVLTPFAIGAAFMSPVAGRLVSRFDRRVTVTALAVMLIGISALALTLPDDVARLSWLLLALPLLIAGIGGGAVVSPNQTLSLAEVPPEMGGAAGAALQTGQRIGAALGSALIVVIYRIGAAQGSPTHGLTMALACSLVILTGALALAIRDAHVRR